MGSLLVWLFDKLRRGMDAARITTAESVEYHAGVQWVCTLTKL